MSFLLKLKHQPQQKQKVQEVISIPAPIGGLNARDPISDMPPSDAYGLNNWIPQALGLKLRMGYASWMEGLAAKVDSIFQYFPATSSISVSSDFGNIPVTLPGKVFAATAGRIYDITTRNNTGYATFTGLGPGNTLTSPDSANADFTTSFTIEFFVEPTSWAPIIPNCIICKAVAAGPQRSYRVQINGLRQIELHLFSNAGVQDTITFDAVPISTTKLYGRIDIDMVNRVATLFTSLCGPSSYTQYGASKFITTLTIFSGTALLEVGTMENDTLNRFAGKIYWVKLYLGIGTSKVLKVSCIPDDSTTTAGPWTSLLTSEVWTRAGTVALTITTVRTLGGATYSGVMVTNMFTNAAGATFLLANSESDGYYTYDGTTWLKVTLGGGATQITPVDPALLVFNLPWKNRVFFIEKDTARVWYTATNALYGTVTVFDFGPLLKHGGAVAYIADWTIDAGTGVDDLLVIVGYNGDVLVFKGTDPASATTFALVGTWFVGEIPAGRKSFSQFGGDLLMLSTSGLFPISYVTRGGAQILQASDKEYTSKIQQKINGDLGATFNKPGWTVNLAARENLLVITTPNTAESVDYQYVMSMITNEWTTFSGVPMNAVNTISGFVLSSDLLGNVFIDFVTPLDKINFCSLGGIGITGFVQPAFSYFGNSGAYKHFLMVRPTFLSSGDPAVSLQMNTDFSSNAPVSNPAIPASTTSKWDTALWNQSVWGGAMKTVHQWDGVVGAGFAGSLAMKVVGEGGTIFASTDYMYEVGGPL